MKTRKIVLLAGIAFLLCVYIGQLIFAHRSPIKSFTLKDAPDSMTITSAENGTITLSKQENAWFINEQRYPADNAQAEQLASLLQDVKSLGVISRSHAAEELRRYGLDDQTKIAVTVRANEKTLRTFEIGKAATTGDQTYVRIDGTAETHLVSGDLQGWFTVSVADLRNNEIYLIDSNKITAVQVTGDETFSFSKKAAADGTTATEWENNLKAADGRASTVDNAKFSEWVALLNGFDAAAWADDNAPLPPLVRTVTLRVADTSDAERTITLSVHDTGNTTEENRRYLCTASTTPYAFYLADNDAKDLLRTIASLQ